MKWVLNYVQPIKFIIKLTSLFRVTLEIFHEKTPKQGFESDTSEEFMNLEL